MSNRHQRQILFPGDTLEPPQQPQAKRDKREARLEGLRLLGAITRPSVCDFDMPGHELLANGVHAGLTLPVDDIDGGGLCPTTVLEWDVWKHYPVSVYDDLVFLSGFYCTLEVKFLSYKFHIRRPKIESLDSAKDTGYLCVAGRTFITMPHIPHSGHAESFSYDSSNWLYQAIFQFNAVLPDYSIFQRANIF